MGRTRPTGAILSPNSGSVNSALSDSGQFGHNAAIFGLVEGPEGLGADVALGTQCKGQLGQRGVIRQLGNGYRVILAHREIEGLQLAARSLVRLLGLVEPGR